MKYLVLIVIVLAVLWLARLPGRGPGRSSRTGAPPRGGGAPQAPQAMVECPVCGVHLPQSDALPGPGGRHFCCAEHRARAES